MLAMVGGEMDKDFDSKLSIQNNSDNHVDANANRSKGFAFRAPQENFTIHDFELGKIYGVGSYSKVQFLFFFLIYFVFWLNYVGLIYVDFDSIVLYFS